MKLSRLKLEWKNLQHSLAHNSAPFLANTAAALSQSRLWYEMQSIQAAESFPVEPVGKIEDDFRWLQFALQGCTQGPAEEDVHTVESWLSDAHLVAEDNARMRPLDRKVISPNLPRRH